MQLGADMELGLSHTDHTGCANQLLPQGKKSFLVAFPTQLGRNKQGQGRKCDWSFSNTESLELARKFLESFWCKSGYQNIGVFASFTKDKPFGERP